MKLWTNQAHARNGVEGIFNDAVDDAVEDALAEIAEAEADAEKAEDIDEEKD